MIYTICPNCEKDLSASAISPICDACGIDFELHKIARNMSDRHYNAGLKHAKKGNLTAAVNTLNISLQTDKYNTAARNLRGLIFFHIERVGEGLSEWLVSIKLQPEKNLAEDYITKFEKDVPLVEKYSSAIANYNEALVFAEKYSEDMSEIRLKRAIEILPNFIDAMNLLALHHLKKDEKAQATALIERVLKIDSGNKLSGRYYRLIFKKDYEPEQPTPSRTAATKVRQAPPTKQPAPQPSNPFSARTKDIIPKASPLSGILTAFLGMGAMFLFMYFLVVPGMIADRDQALTDATALSASIQVSLHNQINSLTEEVNELQIEAQNAQNDHDTQLSHLGQELNQMNVYLAAHHLSEDDPFSALLALDSVVASQLPPQLALLYNQIRDEATPIAQERYFLTGRDLFNAGSYAQARSTLELAAGLSTGESVTSGEVLYLLGRIAEGANDIQRAILYYEAAVENHPTQSRRNAINNRLNTLR